MITYFLLTLVGFTCSDIYLMDSIYDHIFSVLTYATSFTIPSSSLNLFKYWWCPLSRTTQVSHYREKHSPTHLSWSSSNLYQLIPSTTIHSILHLIYVLDSLFAQPLSKSSLVWRPPPHTPYISSPSQCLLSFESNPNKAHLRDDVSDSQAIADRFATHFSALVTIMTVARL